MADNQQSGKWAGFYAVAAALGALGGLSGVVAMIDFFDERAGGETVIEEKDKNAPLPETEALVEAERLAARWFEATKRADATAIVEIADAPFYYDKEMLSTVSSLRQHLERLTQELKQDPDDWQELQALSIDRFETMSIAEFRSKGYDDGDRVINRLTLDDDDVYVGLRIRTDGGDEGVALFFRNADSQLRLVGVWD